MKKRINSKAKGNNAERAVVKILNEYFNTDRFKKVPQSGAFGTIHSKSLSKTEAQVFIGDIITPEEFPFILEVKHYKDVDMWKIFETGETQWDEQLEEEELNLEKSGKKGVVLVFKKNNRKFIAMFKKDLLDIKTYPKMEFEDKIAVPFTDFLTCIKEME